MKNNYRLTAEELRKSILQLAIQGKLVKQNLNDEPASVLVEKIYEEKRRLIAESKIKKDVENLRQLRETIIEEINSLDNYIYIELLTEKYVNKKSLFEIIKTNKDLCYSYAYIKTLHGKALNAFKVKYPNYFLKDNTF